jgi:hypothetical protein
VIEGHERRLGTGAVTLRDRTSRQAGGLVGEQALQALGGQRRAGPRSAWGRAGRSRVRWPASALGGQLWRGPAGPRRRGQRRQASAGPRSPLGACSRPWNRRRQEHQSEVASPACWKPLKAEAPTGTIRIANAKAATLPKGPAVSAVPYTLVVDHPVKGGGRGLGFNVGNLADLAGPGGRSEPRDQRTTPSGESVFKGPRSDAASPRPIAPCPQASG